MIRKFLLATLFIILLVIIFGYVSNIFFQGSFLSLPIDCMPKNVEQERPQHKNSLFVKQYTNIFGTKCVSY